MALRRFHFDRTELAEFETMLQTHQKESSASSLRSYQTSILVAMLGIRDILVRIRIPGPVPLTNGSGSGRPKNMRIRIRFGIPNIDWCPWSGLFKMGERDNRRSAYIKFRLICSSYRNCFCCCSLTLLSKQVRAVNPSFFVENWSCYILFTCLGY
jgi:hypothetical protein